jgi:sporulation protein YlmC with PRC-barrel domain
MTRICPLGSLSIRIIAGSSLLIGLGAPALAQDDSECLRELANVEAKQVGVFEHLGSFERRSLATLRNAVHVLARTEREDACEAVVDAVEDILSERREELVDAGLMVEEGDQARIDQLETAPKVEQLVQPLRAGDVIGSSLRNTRDEYLGEIKDVVFDPEGHEITHALVEVGGFLGLGEEVVAVPLSALRVTDDLETFVIAMPKERFAEAPRLEEGTLSQPDWQAANDTYYALDTTAN